MSQRCKQLTLTIVIINARSAALAGCCNHM